MAEFRSVVTFNDVNVKSARFSRSSAISPFHLFYTTKKSFEYFISKLIELLLMNFVLPMFYQKLDKVQIQILIDL